MGLSFKKVSLGLKIFWAQSIAKEAFAGAVPEQTLKAVLTAINSQPEFPLYTHVGAPPGGHAAMVNQRALAQYQQVNTSGAEAASPHRLVQMLMACSLQRIAEAKGALSRGDAAARGVAIGKAIDIVSGLQASLNTEVSSQIPEQLNALYQYMQQRLLLANARAESDVLDEVAGLMRTIKEGWDGIAPQI